MTGSGPGEGSRGRRWISDDGRRAARRSRNSEAAQPADALGDGRVGAEELPGAARKRAHRVEVGHGGGYRLRPGPLAAATEHPASLCLELPVDHVEPLEGAGETLRVVRQLGARQISAVLT